MLSSLEKKRPSLIKLKIILDKKPRMFFINTNVAAQAQLNFATILLTENTARNKCPARYTGVIHKLCLAKYKLL